MKIFSSTKIRLTFWFVGTLSVILLLFSVAAYFLVESAVRNQTDATLSEIADAFENSVQKELTDEDAEQEGKTIEEAIHESVSEVSFKNYKIVVFSKVDAVLTPSINSGQGSGNSIEDTKTWLNETPDKTSLQTNTFGNESEKFRVHFRPIQIRGETLYLQIIHPLQERGALLAKIGYAFLIIVPLAIFLASFGGYLLVRKSLSPINQMSEKAEEITARNLDERLPVENETDELGRLARTFNRLLARLNLSFEQQQRFMADASHELRTPVAIIRGEADVNLAKERRSTDEYRETIEIMQKEAERMSIIIEDLFALARADAGENAFHKTPVYVEDILADTVKAFRSITAKNGIQIHFENSQEMSMDADQLLLNRLFSNLLDNAVKHAKSTVTITTSLNYKTLEIKFSDDGEGIPAESQSHIFDRFYRADKVRSRQKESLTGSGAGLGLSISKWIVEVHNGKLALLESDHRGSVFSIKFPTS